MVDSYSWTNDNIVINVNITTSVFTSCRAVWRSLGLMDYFPHLSSQLLGEASASL